MNEYLNSGKLKVKDYKELEKENSKKLNND